MKKKNQIPETGLRDFAELLRLYIPDEVLEDMLRYMAEVVAKKRRVPAMNAEKQSPAPTARARPATSQKKASDDKGLWDDFDNWGDNGRTANKDR